jgi:hypothetical protein
MSTGGGRRLEFLRGTGRSEKSPTRSAASSLGVRELSTAVGGLELFGLGTTGVKNRASFDESADASPASTSCSVSASDPVIDS